MVAEYLRGEPSPKILVIEAMFDYHSDDRFGQSRTGSTQSHPQTAPLSNQESAECGPEEQILRSDRTNLT